RGYAKPTLHFATKETSVRCGVNHSTGSGAMTTMQSIRVAATFGLAALLLAPFEAAAKPGNSASGGLVKSAPVAQAPLAHAPMAHAPFAHGLRPLRRGAFRHGWWGGAYFVDPALYGDNAIAGDWYPPQATWGGPDEPAEPLPSGLTCRRSLQVFT